MRQPCLGECLTICFVWVWDGADFIYPRRGASILNAKNESTDPKPATPALLFEFDHLVAGVREATFDILSRMFEGTDFSAMHISRFGLNVPPQKMIENIQQALGQKKSPAKKLADELISGIQMHLETEVIQVSDALRDVIVQARERHMPVYALTALPEHAREALGDRLDLPGLGIEYVPFGVGLEPYPRADAWLKVSKDHDIIGPQSIALTTSHAALKSVLTAGIHCVAIPDRFTEFQDFGGAQAVVESPGEVVLADLIVKPFQAA